MSRNEVEETIRYFFEILEGELPPHERESKLRLALDKLALITHFAQYEFDENDYPEAPGREYPFLRELISPRFPDCGYYNVASDVSENIGDGTAYVGDAIDDICDIAGDLEETLWRWENTSVDDALWHFKFSYDSHWEKHLRDLQLYLYAKEHGW